MGTARVIRSAIAPAPADRHPVGDTSGLPKTAARARRWRTDAAPSSETPTMGPGGGSAGDAPTSRHLLVVDLDACGGVDEIGRLLADLKPRVHGADTQLLAVGVVAREAVAFLVRSGVRLISSAPELERGSRRGVPLAVAVGLWLSGAAPGAALEIVSDDPTFDTVGEVARSRGATFQRLPRCQSLAASGAEDAQPTRDRAHPKSRRRRRRG